MSLYVNPNARHPIYAGAMSLAEAREGAQFITLDTYRGSFELTVLASEWRAETVPLVSGNGFHLRSFIRLRANDINNDVIDFYEKGVHPPVEEDNLWNRNHFSVLAARDNILLLYPWLMKEGFARAANEIQDSFFEFFVDNATFWNEFMRQTNA